MDQMTVRRATVHDAPQIHDLIGEYVKQAILLPVSWNQLYERLPLFAICCNGEEVLGCGALHVVWSDLGEIRSLAVKEGQQGRGIGRQIVRFLEEEADQLGLNRLFALTYEASFFDRLGYRVVEKETLPHKIWKDCIHCIKFLDCKEIAVMRVLQLELDQVPA